MEEKKNELMSQEEFEEHIKEVADNNRKEVLKRFLKGELFLGSFMGVSKYKSIRRAIRRGHVSIFGDLYPKRPFNNRNTKESKIKRQIYGQIKKS